MQYEQIKFAVMLAARAYNNAVFLMVLWGRIDWNYNLRLRKILCRAEARTTAKF